MNRIKVILVAALAALSVSSAFADEGMWTLTALQKVNARQMRRAGLKIPVKSIYNEQKTSLKDAVVIFGGGCTGEIVSSDGLLLTNYHCGYGSIQQLSGIGHNYLQNGFWAMSREEELPVEGLQVRFVKNIDEVTYDLQKSGLTPEKYLENWKAKHATGVSGEEFIIRSFYADNAYYIFRYLVFNDVRLVGAPPYSLGKFGNETDNWMWPRHTCDFSMFRVYSAPDGTSAHYAVSNVPYKAPKALTISLKGYKPGDYTMIMGFPGHTQRYATSYEVEFETAVMNADMIRIRGARQDILKADMLADEATRIKYSSKYQASSNYWKNAIGCNRGVAKLGVIARKQAEEKAMDDYVSTNNLTQYKGLNEAYKQLLDTHREPIKYLLINNEVFWKAIEISRPLSYLQSINLEDSAAKAKIAVELKNFYKDYSKATDNRVAHRMLSLYAEMVPEEHRISIYNDINSRFGGSTDAYADWLYANSVFADSSRCMSALDTLTLKGLKGDAAYGLTASAYASMKELYPAYESAYNTLDSLHKLHMQVIQKMRTDDMYPDANFTIRLTYGKVLPYSPADGVEYNYYTTMKGVIDKEDPKNPFDFTVSDRQKELYYSKDWGGYDVNGELHTCFLTNNDITGGNSGSPVLNAKGQLIGLAFDGNWEAMSGDLAFEPDLQRTICVDIRYVLWVIDVYANAGYLLDEMQIVK